MGLPPRDATERFMEKVREDSSGCHLWQAQVKRDGYGRFQFRGVSVAAHRVAHELFKGPIPEWQCVLHRCGVRTCVNPGHLFLGTIEDNVTDMDRKGRRRTRAKLTKAQAAEIRQRIAEGLSQECVASEFGVDQTSVSRLILGRVKAYL